MGSAESVDRVKRLIYGDILVSDRINEALRKWRRIFRVSQVELANRMGVAPSVISEYEAEVNRSPGAKFLKKFVESLIEIDISRGGRTINLIFSSMNEYVEDKKTILMMKDYYEPFPARTLIEAVSGEVLYGEGLVDRTYLYGFTVIDSISAILSLSGESFYKIFGRTSERAIIFTGVSTGRSPMVAIRIYPLKPRMVVIHRPKKVDELSIKIAEKERIIYVLSNLATVDLLLGNLRAFAEKLVAVGETR